MTAAYVSVAASGALLLAGSVFAFGAHAAIGVLVGGVLAASNLWVLERLVRVYLDGERGRWAGVALLKAAALLVLVALLVKGGVVSVLALVAGYAALPIGITIAGLLPVASPREGG